MYTAFVGTLFGTLILPAASSLFELWFEPESAQESWVVVAAVPVGAFIGLMIALVIAEARKGDRRAARQVAVSGAFCGFLLSVLTDVPVGILCSLAIAFWGIMGRGAFGNRTT